MLPGLEFVAVDFETANSSRGSMCSVGAVQVRDGIVVDSFASLVKPANGHEFAPGNVRVHGITADSVTTAPTWPEVLPRFVNFIQGDVVAAHNARFDTSVLMNTCAEYDLDWPAVEVLCTLQAARAMLQIPSYSLPWVSEHLGLEPFAHHDALSDARAAALILTSLVRMVGAESLTQFTATTRVALRSTVMTESPALSAEREPPDEQVGFVGECVVFTGTLASMTRAEARRLVAEQGGTWQDGVTKTTTLLITGELDPSTFRPGAAYSGKLQKAFDRAAAGQTLEIATEEDFLERAALNAEELRSFARQHSRLPEYVIDQSGAGPADDVWEWLQTALRHPSGRARGGETCTWCTQSIPANAHWIHRDRHVCGIHCNYRLKASAKRAWARAGITVPPLG